MLGALLNKHLLLSFLSPSSPSYVGVTVVMQGMSYLHTSPVHHQCICVYMFVLLVYVGHVLSTHESSSPTMYLCVYVCVTVFNAGHVLSTHESSSPPWSTDYSHQCICVYMLVLLFLSRACPIYTRVQFTINVFLCICLCYWFMQGMSYLHTSPVHHQCIFMYMFVLLVYVGHVLSTHESSSPSMYQCVSVGVTGFMQGMSYLHTSPVHHQCICVYMFVLLVYAGHVLSTHESSSPSMYLCVYVGVTVLCRTCPIYTRVQFPINVSVCICLCYWFMQGMSYLHTSPVPHQCICVYMFVLLVYVGHVLSTHESSSPSMYVCVYVCVTGLCRACPIYTRVQFPINVSVSIFCVTGLCRACHIYTRVQFTINVSVCICWCYCFYAGRVLSTHESSSPSMYLCVYVGVTGLCRTCPIYTRVQFTIMVD